MVVAFVMLANLCQINLIPNFPKYQFTFNCALCLFVENTVEIFIDVIGNSIDQFRPSVEPEPLSRLTSFFFC